MIHLLIFLVQLFLCTLDGIEPTCHSLEESLVCCIVLRFSVYIHNCNFKKLVVVIARIELAQVIELVFVHRCHLQPL